LTPDLFLLLLVIVGSAFFSGCETAYVCAGKYRITGINNISFNQKKFLIQPQRILGTTLVGNNLMSVLASIVAVHISRNFFNGGATIYITLALALLILIFGEVIPKEYSRYNPLKKVRLSMNFLRFLYFLFYPIIQIALIPSQILLHNQKTKLFSRRDLEKLFSHIQWLESISSRDAKIIKGILNIYQRPVRSIMVPRTEITAIENNSSLDQVIAINQKSSFSRYPIFKDNLDNVIGYYHIIDILNMKNDGKVFIDGKDTRHVLVIPGSRNLKDALNDFLSAKTHLAIVMDEYGGTAGLVTLEDVMEEVVGEIFDEFDAKHQLYQQTKSKLFIFEGNTEIHELVHQHNIVLPISRSYHTLAGFIMYRTGRVPNEGDTIIFDKYFLKILRKKSQQIQRVLIRIKS
jgi:putative hemolysin